MRIKLNLSKAVFASVLTNTHNNSIYDILECESDG